MKVADVRFWWSSECEWVNPSSAEVTLIVLQYRHLIPAPVDRTSVIGWLYKHPLIICQKIRQTH